MSPIKQSLAFFLGILFETLLVGLFIPLLAAAIHVQWRKLSNGQKINPVMAFSAVFYGLTILTHWILGARRMVRAGLYLPPGMTVEEYLLPPYSTDEIFRVTIFHLQIVIADVIMVYRMYHIYEKSLLACVIPAITTAGLFVIGCGLTDQLRILKHVKPVPWVGDRWITACFCFTLFNSVFMSTAISLRLWKVHRETPASDTNMGGSVILRAIKVLVESAALLVLFVLINFCGFLAKSNFSIIFLNMTSPVVGITFCLIIVRLGAMKVEAREDSWKSNRTSRVLPFSDSRLSRPPIPLDRVKVEQDVYVSESESGEIKFHVIDSTSPNEK